MSATTLRRRRVARVETAPPFEPGFAGAGHTASVVVDPARFGAAHDPFIALVDDRLDLAEGARAGGEHPHAGFEIATLVLDGALIDRDEGVHRAGDLVWTRAGRGIIHSEEVTVEGFTRILQLWRALPEPERWSEPWFEIVPASLVPVRRGKGAEVRVYAGRSGDVTAPPGRHWPMTLLDLRFQPGGTIDLDLPAADAGFVYVLDGAARAGDDDTPLGARQVGWLERSADDGASMLRVSSVDGARLLLFAGPPIGEPLVFHGPFVGGTRQDLMRVSRDYVEKRFVRMKDIGRAG